MSGENKSSRDIYAITMAVAVPPETLTHTLTDIERGASLAKDSHSLRSRRDKASSFLFAFLEMLSPICVRQIRAK